MLCFCSGIIKMAGDISTMEKKEYIGKKEVEVAIRENKPIEEKVREKYGSWWAAESADYGVKIDKAGPETA